MGGVAIAVASLPAVVAATQGVTAWLAVLGLAVAFIVGFVDDRTPLSPRQKFVGQLIASALGACAVVAGTGWLETGGGPGAPGAPVGLGSRLPAPLVIALGTIWIAAFQNAVNFLDNIDGVSPGTAAIALAGLSLFWAGDPAAAVAGALALGTIGFLPYNVTSRAKLFLGDAGSLMLGQAVGYFSLGAIALSGGLWDACAIAVVVLVPVADITFVVVTRLASGRSPAQGGRDHTTHRLFARQGSVTATFVTFWVVGIVLAVTGLVLTGPAAAAALCVLVIAGLELGRRMARWPTPG